MMLLRLVQKVPFRNMGILVSCFNRKTAPVCVSGECAVGSAGGFKLASLNIPKREMEIVLPFGLDLLQHRVVILWQFT